MNLYPVSREAVGPTLATRAWHRIQERIRSPQMRRAVASSLASLKPRAGISAPPALPLRELLDDGVTVFASWLDAAAVQRIRSALEGMDCIDPWNLQAGHFRWDAIPAGTHVAQIPHATRIPELHRIALDPQVLSLVAAYFGCRPVLDSIQAWWSVSGNATAQEAENFHRDNDAIRFLKLFIYLTDVDLANGPHVFVAGSPNDKRLTDHRRLGDDEVIAAYGVERIKVMTGRAGDAFLEDTWGIHKGQLPQQGLRLLAQVRYAVTETIFRAPLTVRADIDQRSVTSLVVDPGDDRSR